MADRRTRARRMLAEMDMSKAYIAKLTGLTPNDVGCLICPHKSDALFNTIDTLYKDKGKWST